MEEETQTTDEQDKDKGYSYSHWKGEIGRAENFLKKWNRKSSEF